MSSIDTNIVSQLDSKRPFGAAKSMVEGGGEKFSETFYNLAGKGGARNSITREAMADGVIKAGTDALPSLQSAAAIQDRFAADAGKQDVQAPLPGTVAEASDTDVTAPAQAAENSLSGTDIPALVAEAKATPPRHADDGKTPSDGPARPDADGSYDGLLDILAGTPANAEQAQITAAASVAVQGAQQQAGETGADSARSVTTGVTELMLANVPARAVKGGETGDTASGRARAQSTHLGDAARGATASAMAPDASADASVAADDVASSDADQVFRLVRSDGRARPVEIAIGGNGDVAVKEQGTPAAKIEAVTVLDSRRYLGLAPSSNGAAVTSAIAHDPALASALTAVQDDKTTGKVVNTLKIQLNPIDLGTVTATLRLQGEALTVDLKVETGKAYRNLSDDQDAIVKALRGHGFAVDQVSVQLTFSSDRSGSTGQGDPQAQFTGQQQAREGGGQQQGGHARQTDTKAFNEGTSYDYGQADGSSGANQSRGSGGVYL